MRRGIDLFDCVMPTRNGRNALAFTDAGRVRLRNLQVRARPAAAGSRLPLRRLPAQPRLPAAPVSGGRNAGADPALEHNLTYYQRLLAAARAAIEAGEFEAFAAEKLARWAA